VLRWESNSYTCIVLLTSRCCGVLYLELTGHTIMMQCCHVKEYEEHTKFYLHNTKYTSKSLLLDCVDMVKLAGGYSVATGQWFQLRQQDTIFWLGCHGIAQDKNVLGTEILVIREFLVNQGFPQHKLFWWLDTVWHSFNASGAPIPRNVQQYGQAGRTTGNQKAEGSRKKELVIKFYLVDCNVEKGPMLNTFKNFRTAMGHKFLFGHSGFRMEYFINYTNMYVSATHSNWVDTPHSTVIAGVRDHLFAEEVLDILCTDTRNRNVISQSGCVVYSNESTPWTRGRNGASTLARLLIFWDRDKDEEPTSKEAVLEVDHWHITVKSLKGPYTGNVLGGVNVSLQDSRVDFKVIGERYQANHKSVSSPAVMSINSPSRSPAAKRTKKAVSNTPNAMTIRTPQSGSETSSAVSSTLTNRTGNTSNTEISRRTESDNVILQLQERLARLEAEMVTASMDRVQVQDKIGSLEQRMTQMSNSALNNILARLQEAANRVQDAQGKVTIIEKRLNRCTDSSAKMDIEDKLA